MSKMTVIQLLNKIANDEEVPKKIKYEGRIWEYDASVQDYMDADIVEYLFAKMFGMKTERVLNCEVEIIEEPKKIEYPILHKTAPSETTGDQMPNWRNLIDCSFEHLNKTIYQLIDEINNLKENK